MQIDFHFAVTYIIGRLAGFDANDSYIIAYSSQQVDDSVSDDTICFDNGAVYKPVCSAHKMLDYKNFDELQNHLSWVPFHFFPGNCGFPQGKGTDKDFVSRIVCRSNSCPANDMLRECIRNKAASNSLHRLGITMHVYADTWAHKGFAGVCNKTNQVSYFEDDDTSRTLFDRVKEFFKDLFDDELGHIIDKELPLGHGAVLTYPDLPYLEWKYKNSTGEVVFRNNPEDFVEAANHMYMAMKKYRYGDADAKEEELDSSFRKRLKKIFISNNNCDGRERNNKLIKMISEDAFGFGKEKIEYVEDKWKNEALEKSDLLFQSKYKFTDTFMKSDWKKFNDALKDHEYFVTRVLFPGYGICIA